MRLRTISLALAAAAIMVIGLAGTGLAFHDGGVARCAGCHTMHNSVDGQIADSQLTTPFTTGAYLLKGTDQSSACLNCHGSGATTSGYHVYTELADMVTGAPQQFSPGGDFTWLKVGTGTQATRDKIGHNIKGADYTLPFPDGRLTVGPGGTYPREDLGCQSCHDPHGRYRITSTSAGAAVLPTIGSTIDGTAQSGSYGATPTAGSAVGTFRILGGVGYKPDSATGPAFSAAPPVAVAPSTYNTTDGYKVRVAYGAGMSEWCGNCHGNIHNDTYPTTLRHPAGDGAKLTAVQVVNYNAYVKSGDLTGVFASAYDPLVPFEIGSTDVTVLAPYAATDIATGSASSREGAATTNNVMCLSCHRAHATAFASMMRWDQAAALFVEGGAWLGIDGINTVPQMNAAFYNRPVGTFATEQRSLCNKCHVKD